MQRKLYSFSGLKPSDAYQLTKVTINFILILTAFDFWWKLHKTLSSVTKLNVCVSTKYSNLIFEFIIGKITSLRA